MPPRESRTGADRRPAVVRFRSTCQAGLSFMGPSDRPADTSERAGQCAASHVKVDCTSMLDCTAGWIASQGRVVDEDAS